MSSQATMRSTGDRGAMGGRSTWNAARTSAILMVMLSSVSAAQGTVASSRETSVASGGGWDEALLLSRAAARSLPIGIRPFSSAMLDSLVGSRPVKWIEPTSAWTALWFASQRPFDDLPGPVWRGRGFTVAASAGVAGRTGVLSWALRPIAFQSQNADYQAMTEQLPAGHVNPWWPGNIDRPRAFGPTAYGRIDAGESYVRVDVPWVGAGISNVAQTWGPARMLPLLLGSAAGGFPHVFMETARPLDVGAGHVHVRWMVGRLASSAFGPDHPGTRRRLAPGVVGSFMPRGLPGLEIGGARFFHLYDSASVRDGRTALLPFSGLLKSSLVNPDASDARQYNQLLSVFLRVAPPNAGIEVFGELLREDHAWDARDAFGEPDHATAYMIGLVASRGHGHFGIEASNGRMSHIDRVRDQAVVFTHSTIVEGHTHRGLPLGSASLPGGGAMRILYRRSHASRPWWVLSGVTRAAQNREGGSWSGRTSGWLTVGAGMEAPLARQRLRADVRLESGHGVVAGMNAVFGLTMLVTDW